MTAPDMGDLEAVDRLDLLPVVPWRRARHVERDQRILELYRAGVSVREIGFAVGLTWGAIRGVLVRHQEPFRGRQYQKRGSQNLDRDRGILTRLEDGETFSAIAKDLGITRERVRQLARRHGVMRATLGPRPPRLTTIARRVERDALADATRRKVRARQKAARRHIVDTLRMLHLTLGYVPTHRELGEALGMPVAAILAKFVVRGCRRSDYGRRGSARLYRAAGLQGRLPGSPGHRVSSPRYPTALR